MSALVKVLAAWFVIAVGLGPLVGRALRWSLSGDTGPPRDGI